MDNGASASQTGLGSAEAPAPSGRGPSDAIPSAVPLRVWWVPQMPMKAFEIDVPDLATADLLLDVLADYDRFQFENNVKPDYCNAGGLMMLEDGEWVDWFDDTLFCDFDEYRAAHGRRADKARGQ